MNYNSEIEANFMWIDAVHDLKHESTPFQCFHLIPWPWKHETDISFLFNSWPFFYAANLQDNAGVT
jgi:hypothetical protein